MNRKKLLNAAIKEAEAIFGNKTQEWYARCLFEKCNEVFERNVCPTSTIINMLFHEQDRKTCKVRDTHKFIIATKKDSSKVCLLDGYMIVKI